MKSKITFALAASILSLTLSAFPYSAGAGTTTTPTPAKPSGLHPPGKIHQVTAESSGMSIAETVIDLARSALTFLAH